jgi:hypothetical protein
VDYYCDKCYIVKMFTWFNIHQLYHEDYKYHGKVNGVLKNNLKVPAIGFMQHITWFVLLFLFSWVTQVFQLEIYFLKERLLQTFIGKQTIWAVWIGEVWNFLLYLLCPSSCVKNETQCFGARSVPIFSLTSKVTLSLVGLILSQKQNVLFS